MIDKKKKTKQCISKEKIRKKVIVTEYTFFIERLLTMLLTQRENYDDDEFYIILNQCINCIFISNGIVERKENP